MHSLLLLPSEKQIFISPFFKNREINCCEYLRKKKKGYWLMITSYSTKKDVFK